MSPELVLPDIVRGRTESPILARFVRAPSSHLADPDFEVEVRGGEHGDQGIDTEDVYPSPHQV